MRDGYNENHNGGRVSDRGSNRGSNRDGGYSRPAAVGEPPKEGSIHKGKVSRIESYGAFVDLCHPYRGLVHISQLANIQLKAVEDAVSPGDILYVKVLECQEQIIPNSENVTDNVTDNDERYGNHGRNGGGSRKRHKIRLSAKYASQDGMFTDLDPDGIQADRDGNSSSSFNQYNSNNSNNNNRNNGVPSELEKSLNSKIGMGVGLDPAATMQQANTRIVIRGQQQQQQQRQSSTTGQVVINGYALVDAHDDHDHDTAQVASNSQSRLPTKASNSNRPVNISSTLATANARSSLASAPMGRGRGATLPAWMTKESSTDQTRATDANPPTDRHPHRRHDDASHESNKYRTSTDRYASPSSSSSRGHAKRTSRTRHRSTKHRSTRNSTTAATNNDPNDQDRTLHNTNTNDDTGTGTSHRKKDHRSSSPRDRTRHRHRTRRKIKHSTDTHDHDSSSSTSETRTRTRATSGRRGEERRVRSSRKHRSDRGSSRRRRGGRSYRDESDSDARSRGRSDRGRGRHHRKHKHGRRKRSRTHRSHRDYSSDSCSTDDTSSRSPKFENVEQAKKLIAALEQKQKLT